MLTLNDGRSELWQWDTGRTLAVDADCSQVHFSNKVFGRSIDVDVVDGTAIIPDVLLQTDKDLNVWAFFGTAENGYTKISKTFNVNRRNKPADYVFTPPEQTSLEEIKEKIDYLESIQDPDAIKNAVDDYLEKNPVEAPVQSVNGQTGAVELTAEDVGAIAVETDPTVPEWAKQPQKPTYTANEIGAVSQDDLQAATNEALAQAKASGEFDGPQGPQGPAGKDGADGAPGKNGTSATHSWNGTVLTITSASGTSSSDLKGDKGDKGNTGPAGKDGTPGADGKTPEYGVDYGTPEQIAEIAQHAAEILQPDVNQIKNDLADKVPKSDYAPEAKTDAMTQPVGKDADGKLWTAPGSGGGGGTWKTLAEFFNAEEVSELVFGSEEAPLNIRNFILAFSGSDSASNSNPLLGVCGYYNGLMSVDNSAISLTFYLSDGTSRGIKTASIRMTRSLFFSVDLDRGFCCYRSGFFGDVSTIPATNFYFSNAQITKIVVRTVADGCVFNAHTNRNKIYLFTFGA